MKQLKGGKSEKDWSAKKQKLIVNNSLVSTPESAIRGKVYAD
jgi:hypothetical protein